MSGDYVIHRDLPAALVNDHAAFAAFQRNLRVNAEEDLGRELPPGEYTEISYAKLTDDDPPGMVACAQDEAEFAHVRMTFTDGNPTP